MAVYGGDSNFITSTSTALTQTVNQDATKTTVTSSANPSVSGQPIIFTATVKAVAPGSGVPTGTVTFYDGSTSLGTAQLYGSGHATISISTLVVGSHMITASYVGDGNFTASASTSPDPDRQPGRHEDDRRLFGQPLRLRSAGHLHRDGQSGGAGDRHAHRHRHLLDQWHAAILRRTDGDQRRGSGHVHDRAASAGTYTITAVYDGDSNFTTSTSKAFSQRVK